jgi:cytidyltransferase-like protein
MLDHGPILELPLSHQFFHSQVEAFLSESGLRLEDVDHYYVYQSPDGSILSGAGLKADIIKCVAVAPSVRSEGYLTPLLSRIISDSGLVNFKVFTKPEYKVVFESLGFKLLAQAPEAVFMEKGRGLEKYCEYLRGFARPGRSGVVVMNANPFTLGHLYLLQEASKQVDTLFVIPVMEDVSEFPYAERQAMIETASAHLASEKNYFLGRCPKNQFSSDNTSPTHADASSVIPGPSSVIPSEAKESIIIVLEGSAYTISAATFPTYFLKDLSTAAETQMRLDVDLFERWIMPALGATVRFVGSEPLDPLTARYNSLMHNAVEIPRYEIPDQVGDDGIVDASSSVIPGPDPESHATLVQEGSSSVMPGTDRASHAISASAVRKYLEAGDYASAAALCPVTTYPYLLAALAERALLMELNTPSKPGLVGPDGPGAHKDMSYDTMLAGIKALRPFWSRMAMAESPEELRNIGLEAEDAMLAATGGVNTHRGAIFCFGLTVNTIARFRQLADNESLMHSPPGKNDGRTMRNELIISILRETALTIPLEGSKSREGIRGARQMALDGYRDLFEDWLPYYRKLQWDTLGLRPRYDNNTLSVIPSEASVSHATRQKLLLRIMSTLDDTCVIKRVGYDRAQKVKLEAASALPSAEENYFSGRRPKNQFSSAVTSLTLADALKDLCDRYAAEGISPGGAADMLALTIFIDSII